MDNTMSERLVNLRLKNNYSQSFVARQIGVTPALINDCSITKNELKSLKNTEFSCQK